MNDPKACLVRGLETCGLPCLLGMAGSYPLPGRALRSNVPRGRHGCLPYLFSNNTMNRLAFHQSSHSAARNGELLALHLMPDLSDAVDFIVLFPNTFDLGAQIRVPSGTIGRQVRVFEDRSMRIECPLSLILRINCRAADWAIGKTLQIGSTPKSSRCSAMKAIIF